jgi:hypothetical protein
MSTLYGVYPEEHRVEKDLAHKRILVATPYYEVEHSLAAGGQVGAIRFPRIRRENILLEPVGVELGLVGAPKPFRPAANPKLQIARADGEVALTFETQLVDADGKAAGALLKTRFAHRWGYIRIRQELEFPAAGLDAAYLTLNRWLLRPELTHYSVRPGVGAEASSWPAAFGVSQWGRFRPGCGFDSAYESRFVPRYVGLADPGRCGIEWFVGSQLAQWDFQLAGRPGLGSLLIQSQPAPPAVSVAISPLAIAGVQRLAGRFVFDSYIGIPIVSGRAHPPFLHASFNRKQWPSEAQVAKWARTGIRTAHFHHDGDAFQDKLFWRDGSYPPFAPEDMKEYDRVIAACHRHDIRVATYFSNKELHPSVPAFKEHGAEWARLPDDRGEIFHNFFGGDEFGGQMCLRSGWLDCLKQYIDTVLSHHALDGTYYDWNLALYCHNAKHVGMEMPPPGRLGALAHSPAGHLDMDELVDLMEWTRRRVGPEGLMITHDTMSPMAATENFSDLIVAMEWGYSMLSAGAPELDDLPLEWTFMGARARGVIGYGCLAKNTPASVHKQMNVRCLLTGVAPWPADALDLRMFAPLRGFDPTGFVFHDWRSGAVRVADPGAAGAVYSGRTRALLLVGDLRGRARTVEVVPGRAALPGRAGV